MGMSMLNMPTSGMHDVDTTWNGMSASHDVSMEDHYGYFCQNYTYAYECEVDVPTGMSDYDESNRHVVQYGGEARSNLPPLKPSTGLRVPNVTNPYLDQRDASYDHSYDYSSSQSAESMFPIDNFAPEKFDKPWQLGENDLLSMFNDYYHDDYGTTMELAYEAAHRYVPTTDLETDGVFNPNPIDETPSCIKQDSWMAYEFQLTRDSENWTTVEMEDVQYHWMYEMYNDAAPQVQQVEPELIMTADAGGKSTPMASCVMVAKSIQGRACSRLLRVLFDSGGSKSMCHRRVLPRGANITQVGERTMMRTLAGIYAPLGTATIQGMRMPAFDKNRIVDEHDFHVFDEECGYDLILGGDFLKKVGINLKYDTLEVEWFGNTVPMESLQKPTQMAAYVDSYLAQMEVDDMGFDVDS